MTFCSSFTGDLVGPAKGAGRYDGGGGLAAGDALCELEAAGLPQGKWHSWLSLGGNAGDAGATGQAAIARFYDMGPRVGIVGGVVLPRLGVTAVALVPDRDGRTDGGAMRSSRRTTTSSCREHDRGAARQPSLRPGRRDDRACGIGKR